MRQDTPFIGESAEEVLRAVWHTRAPCLHPLRGDLRMRHRGLFGMIGVVGICGLIGLSAAADPVPHGVADIRESLHASSTTVQLARGTQVMQLLADPPRLLGAETDLSIQGQRLTGVLAGGRYEAQMSDERIEGSGPYGKIDVRITRGPGSISLEGTWNGQPMNVSFAPGAMRAKVIRRATTEGKGLERCDYDLDQPRGEVLSGFVQCLGKADQLRVSLQTIDPSVLLGRDTALMLAAFLAAPPALVPQ
jgi:hypothetical protein